jgi:hypothetical protein
MDRQLETLTIFFLNKTFRKYLIKNIDKNSQDICKIEIFQTLEILKEWEIQVCYN